MEEGPINQSLWKHLSSAGLCGNHMFTCSPNRRLGFDPRPVASWTLKVVAATTGLFREVCRGPLCDPNEARQLPTSGWVFRNIGLPFVPWFQGKHQEKTTRLEGSLFFRNIRMLSAQCKVWGLSQIKVDVFLSKICRGHTFEICTFVLDNFQTEQIIVNASRCPPRPSLV